MSLGVDDANAWEVQLAFRVGPVVRERIGRVVKTRHLEELDNALRHDILNQSWRQARCFTLPHP